MRPFFSLVRRIFVSRFPLPVFFNSSATHANPTLYPLPFTRSVRTALPATAPPTRRPRRRTPKTPTQKTTPVEEKRQTLLLVSRHLSLFGDFPPLALVARTIRPNTIPNGCYRRTKRYRHTLQTAQSPLEQCRQRIARSGPIRPCRTGFHAEMGTHRSLAGHYEGRQPDLCQRIRLGRP